MTTGQLLLQSSCSTQARPVSSRRSVARNAFKVSCGSRQPRNEPLQRDQVALQAIGGLAAAALLLAPNMATAATRLPPVDSGKNLADKVLSGALVSEADFSKTSMNNATMTKAYAKGANFSGADMTNAVLDRVDFTNANLSGAKFTNAVITGAKFAGANLDKATFEDALIGQEDYKQLCANPTVTGDTRVDIGCKTR